MAAKKKTREVEKTLHTIYWAKATSSYEAFQMCNIENNWHSVGVNGVHTCISVADALCVKLGGVKNAGDHGTGPALLKDVLTKQRINNSGIAAHCQQYQEVINLKNLIEYESKPFTSVSAQLLIKKVERFYQWAQKIITSS